MRNLGRLNNIVVVLLFSASIAIVSPAQTFNNLLSFDNTDGGYPVYGSLVQGIDGNFYGTTSLGGFLQCDSSQSGCGTVFKVTPEGILTTLYSFCVEANCPDGELPYAGLVLGTDGNFYGVTVLGGLGANGTVFKITPTGTLTTLHNFDETDGAFPYNALIQGRDGDFYGTAYSGGASNDGTVFRITPTGALTTLYNFCAQSNCSDGAFPTAGLIQATDGNFYGTTRYGGTSNLGTVFKISSTGALTALHSFMNTDGGLPYGTLLQASNGNFYGTTEVGGIKGNRSSGTVFKMTAKGALTTLHNFQPGQGGPYDGLVLGTDGNLYGTTAQGGTNNFGQVFNIGPTDTLTTLHSFDGADGRSPYAGLLQATNGTFYGMTLYGGASGSGEIYSLSMGLGPFITFVRNPAKVRQVFGILGQGFTGTTSVSLNGTPASFTIVSDTFIKAMVPAGATTGYVTVSTPTGTLSSNVRFHVIP